jgi:hypothetical protein
VQIYDSFRAERTAAGHGPTPDEEAAVAAGTGGDPVESGAPAGRS